jgi:hypothetical protein
MGCKYSPYAANVKIVYLILYIFGLKIIIYPSFRLKRAVSGAEKALPLPP